MAKVPAQSSHGEARTPSALLASTSKHDASTTRLDATNDYGHPTESRMVIRGPSSGHALASFMLPDSDGRTVNVWNYRQRTNLVLFFHHGSACPECRSMLRELAEHSAAYREEEAVILAIGPDKLSDARKLAMSLDCPFPLL